MMNLESKYSRVPYVFVIAMSCLSFSCELKESGNLANSVAHVVIPQPVEIILSDKTLLIEKTIDIQIGDAQLESSAEYMLTALGRSGKVTKNKSKEGIRLSLDANNTELGVEGYSIQISESLLSLSANHPHGIFNGIQTILQLSPTNVGELQQFEIQTGQILDYPRYGYRGSMLDVSRHFFDLEDVKRYIDFLVYYKMNVLHLHLTDDQGWRIEIKSRPELTNIGSTSEVGTGSGGYFTQEQYKEIVKYAADRFITIIPEIDMPGHTQAALASYPELSCDGKVRELYRGTEVGFSTLCTESEATYEFVDAVIKELAAITPGEYIHIGGDESHVTKEEDYIYFINRVQQIVTKYGKTMIGWDEIALSDIDGSTLVQQWNSAGNAIRAAKKGNSIILSPAKTAYMDMKYNEKTRIGLNWAGFIEIDHAYNWDPSTINSEISSGLIVGIEAPLWTETVENMEDIEYLVFPRLPGYAEIGWSQQSVRSWTTYRDRLANHAKWFEANEINFYRSSMVDW